MMTRPWSSADKRSNKAITSPWTGLPVRFISAICRLKSRNFLQAYYTILKWADTFRTINVRTNADTPYDAVNAVKMGAEGIGLCRTEHMFFDTEERRLAIQEMIVAETLESRKAALAKLLPFQREDFYGIFKAMDGKPVTIRLIDPPLHEFTPKDDAGIDGSDKWRLHEQRRCGLLSVARGRTASRNVGALPTRPAEPRDRAERAARQTEVTTRWSLSLSYCRLLPTLNS